MCFYLFQIDALEKPLELPLSKNGLGFGGALWPEKVVFFQYFPPQGVTSEVPVDHFDRVLLPIREYKKRFCIVRLLSQCFLGYGDQSMSVLTEIHRSVRDEDPCWSCPPAKHTYQSADIVRRYSRGDIIFSPL